MDERKSGLLEGLRVLVVEDEPLVAMALSDDLAEAGAVIVGPAASVERALGLVERQEIHAAVLDIKLQAEMVFPVADALAARGVAFVFTTGFDAGMLPPEYAEVPKCEKPANSRTVIELLAGLAGRPI